MGLFKWILNYWNKRQEDKKWQEFYARLDRNAEGKFTKAQYIRDTKKVIKAEKNKK